MTAFAIQVAQNQYLAPDSRQVHAVVSVNATRDAGAAPTRPLVEALLIDCSQSMTGDRIQHAKAAVERAIDLLRDDAFSCVIPGTDPARVVSPLAQATEGNRKAAHAAVRGLKADGGTAMSTWLAQARQEFRKMPDAIHHALLLTD